MVTANVDQVPLVCAHCEVHSVMAKCQPTGVSVGVASVGVASVGVVSVGVASVGMVSVGVVSVGVASVDVVSVGWGVWAWCTRH